MAKTYSYVFWSEDDEYYLAFIMDEDDEYIGAGYGKTRHEALAAARIDSKDNPHNDVGYYQQAYDKKTDTKMCVYCRDGEPVGFAAGKAKTNSDSHVKVKARILRKRGITSEQRKLIAQYDWIGHYKKRKEPVID